MTDLVLGKVMLFANNMTRMVGFYRDVLGFKTNPTTYDPEEFVVLDAGRSQLCLHRIPEEHACDISEPPKPRSGTPIKIMFETGDVETVRSFLIARGVPMGPLQSFPPLAYCDGPDPEGNIFQITNGKFEGD